MLRENWQILYSENCTIGTSHNGKGIKMKKLVIKFIEVGNFNTPAGGYCSTHGTRLQTEWRRQYDKNTGVEITPVPIRIEFCSNCK